MSAVWIILSCIISCDDDIAAARRDGFSYAQEMQRNEEDGAMGRWDEDISLSEVRRRSVAALQGRQFPTRAACLAALKKALPARIYVSEERAHISVEHYRDHVEESIWVPSNQSQYYACYHREPVVG